MLSHMDHLVLTTANIERCIAFYSQVLGLRVQSFGEGRKALAFGNQKINLHLYGQEWEPKAHHPMPGSLDLCFITKLPLDQVIAHLLQTGVAILEGPVMRTGATGLIRSVYLRDPDLNLIEIAEYPDAAVEQR